MLNLNSTFVASVQPTQTHSLILGAQLPYLSMHSLRSLPLEVASFITRPRLPLSTALRTTTLLTRHASAYHTSTKPRHPHSFLPVPFITESLAGATHTTDLFSRLLKERIVALYGEVDDRMAATVTASLLYLEADDPSKPISLYINSPGGSVSAGLAIYDTLQYITPSISTICLGQAASMGSLLLAGGSPGKRYILPHASVMLHQPSGGYHGTAADIAIHAKEILRVRRQLNMIYEKHLTPRGEGGRATGRKTVEEIEKMMERDYFLSAEEALEVGVVDEILGSRKAGGGEKEGEGEKKE
jgi:ATP-dependent Clp protease, protease subunit